jgi:hypothetical protein
MAVKFPPVLGVVMACLLLVSKDVAVADGRKLTGANHLHIVDFLCALVYCIVGI